MIQSFINRNNLKPADAVVVTKDLFPFFKHYVIFLGYDEWSTPVFIANTGGGIRRMTNSEMTKLGNGYSVSGLNRFIGNDYQRREAVNRALSRYSEQNYDLILNNCEHFSTYVQTGKSESRQVQAAGTALGAVALLGLLVLIFGGGDNKGGGKA